MTIKHQRNIALTKTYLKRQGRVQDIPHFVPDVLLLQQKVKCQFVSIDRQSIRVISDK